MAHCIGYVKAPLKSVPHILQIWKLIHRGVKCLSQSHTPGSGVGNCALTALTARHAACSVTGGM